MASVKLLGLPVQIWKRTSAHQDALHREFEILMADLPADSIPHQFLELVENLRARFRGVGDEIRPVLLAAAERGETAIDLTLSAPPEVAPAIAELGAMLNAADEFCREGERLLTLATPPDLVRFRRWFIEEFVRQVEEGHDPTPWSRYSANPADPDQQSRNAEDDANPDTHVIRFEDDLDLATAGGLRDEILAARKRGPTNLLLDLKEVGFMDSVGLSLLVSTHQRVTKEGTEVRLLLPAHLRRLLEISGLVEVLKPEFVGDEGPGANDR